MNETFQLKRESLVYQKFDSPFIDFKKRVFYKFENVLKFMFIDWLSSKWFQYDHNVSLAINSSLKTKWYGCSVFFQIYQLLVWDCYWRIEHKQSVKKRVKSLKILKRDKKLWSKSVKSHFKQQSVVLKYWINWRNWWSFFSTGSIIIEKILKIFLVLKSNSTKNLWSLFIFIQILIIRP